MFEANQETHGALQRQITRSRVICIRGAEPTYVMCNAKEVQNPRYVMCIMQQRCRTQDTQSRVQSVEPHNA